MARQPFLPKYRGRSLFVGLTSISNVRPEMALIISDCIVIWPSIEHELAVTLGHLIGARSDATMAVFSALRGFRSQSEVVQAAADAVLSEDDRDLVAACLSSLWTVQRARDDIAHGIWGTLPDEMELLIWIQSKDMSPWSLALTSGSMTDEKLTTLAERMFVYTKDDLIEVRTLLERGRRISYGLMSYCGWRDYDPEPRETISDRLKSEPLVAQALAHLNDKKNKS